MTMRIGIRNNSMWFINVYQDSNSQWVSLSFSGQYPDSYYQIWTCMNDSKIDYYL